MQRHHIPGWSREPHDPRDHNYSLAQRFAPPAKRPKLQNLVPIERTVYDQSQLGSCTGNAFGKHLKTLLAIEGKPLFDPSRLFIYYCERALEGTIRSDAGAQIRDGAKSLAKQGVCPETDWPYDIAKFRTPPSPRCYADAAKHVVTSYHRLTGGLTDMLNCLASGYPFVFGIDVFESFESDAIAKTGNVPLPTHGEKMVGGHAVCCVGYNDGLDVRLKSGQIWPTRTLLVQNSWGKEWGLQCDDFWGCFTLPYEYAADPKLADDFWTMRIIA